MDFYEVIAAISWMETNYDIEIDVKIDVKIGV